jgi:GT2 family glycosyltransferase
MTSSSSLDAPDAAGESIAPAMGLSTMGIVVIGRNEGRRLVRCLESVLRFAAFVVYVDSGSTDGSAAKARALGVEVVELDMRRPFTAALARNAGWRRLLEIAPGIACVHFLDGDCEVVPGWLETAHHTLMRRQELAVVCGRRRERFPEASAFNRQCEIEWNAAVGEVRSCGGDALMRVSALQAVDGYRDDLIAGEEPELCVRLREAGWKIWRVNRDMVWHDAAMRHWSQWWKRSKRAGHAFAEGVFLHGAPPERHYVTEERRALIWGAFLPLAALLLAAINPVGLLLLAAYPLQILRLALNPEAAAREADAAWSRAFFLVAGRFPEAAGVLLFRWHRLRGRTSTLIEYK